MTDLLIKIFVKDYKKTNDSQVRMRYGMLVSIVCITLNILLAAGKLIIGIFVGSVAIQADAVNNFSDAGSSVISLVSFRISGKPADREHPFGHARIEYVASMIVSFIIMIIGVQLLKNSVMKIIHPEKTEFSIVSVIILSASVLCKLWMSIFNRRVGKKIDSEVMRATAADSLSDVISTSAVLISSVILYFTGLDIDAYVGILVAAFIIFTGVKILAETKNSILGEAPVEKDVDGIKRIVSEYPEALGVHDMMVHNYGPGHTIASLHIEVDGEKDIFETHDVVDRIEKRINNELGIICTVHLDPIITNDSERNRVLGEVTDIVDKIDEKITIHDFRLVRGTTHSNLIFDVVVPFENKESDSEIKAQITEAIKKVNEKYDTVITVDRG